MKERVTLLKSRAAEGAAEDDRDSHSATRRLLEPREQLVSIGSRHQKAIGTAFFEEEIVAT